MYMSNLILMKHWHVDTGHDTDTLTPITILENDIIECNHIESLEGSET